MTIAIRDLLRPYVLKSLYERRTTLAMVGPPGIGKSAVSELFPTLLAEVFKEPFGFSRHEAPTVDYPDVRGVCIPTKGADGVATSVYTYPALMPTREYLKEFPRGVMVVDEFNSGDHSVQKAEAALIHERRMGDYKLPDGWWVVTASNRMSDRAGVVRPLMHLVNRVCTVEIRPDVDSLVSWMESNMIHPLGPAFVRERPDVVFSDTVPADPRPFCTPRSFTSAMKYITALVGDSLNVPNDDVTQQIITGDIGEGAAATFLGWLKVVNDLPTIEEIKRDPLKAKVPGPDKLAAAYVAVQLLVHCMNEANTDQLWLYAQRLPRELQVTAATKLMNRRDGYLLNSQEFGKWLGQNRALITASRPS